MIALLPPAFDAQGLLLLALGVFLGALIVGFLLQLLVCWLVYNAALAIPKEHREIEPALAFLLLVPFLGVFLNFLVQPAVSRSYRRWFAARGVTTEGDCGESLAWWYAILCVCAWVPCVPLAGLVAIVLQVVYLLRLRRVHAAGRAMIPA